MSLFLQRLKEVQSKGKEVESSGVWKSKLVVKHFEKIANLEDDLIRLPTSEEFFFLQTDL